MSISVKQSTFNIMLFAKLNVRQFALSSNLPNLCMCIQYDYCMIVRYVHLLYVFVFCCIPLRMPLLDMVVMW